MIEDQQVALQAPDVQQAPAVIWISGYSASGKTTVGRRVEAMLRDDGVPAILLDGDDLRSIFAGRWGYSREERVELARVYFRLCSHLAAQGLTVVISAVAMYDDVRRWLKENVSAAVEVFLDVPESERVERDRATKGIYEQIGPQNAMYDEPRAPDLVVRNHGHVTAEAAAREIVDHVQGGGFARTADHGRTNHWRAFYARSKAPDEPSNFALSVAGDLHSAVDILEVGCGNGRDASFFAAEGLRVLALDASESAIESARRTHSRDGLSFFAGRIADLAVDAGSFDAVYSRFCLHAMTPDEEDEFLFHALGRLRPDGNLFVECRSINDPLARKGEVISKTERILGHYRRFIVPEELRAKLDALGFRIEAFEESAGLAKFGDDDPVVIRLRASVPS